MYVQIHIGVQVKLIIWNKNRYRLNQPSKYHNAYTWSSQVM